MEQDQRSTKQMSCVTTTRLLQLGFGMDTFLDPFLSQCSGWVKGLATCD